jgi:methionine-rich copper-binding protein CopC
MKRLDRRFALAALAAAAVAASASPAHAQTATPKPAAPVTAAPDRFRLVLNASFWPMKTSFSDTRTLTEYAEQTTIQTSYDANTGFGPDVALQVSLFRGLGLLVGYSYVSRDVTGQVDVSRPHPLYLNRNRTASSEISGYGLTEGALHLDLAYARAAGPLDWALFAGATLFQVQADLLQTPTYDDVYPYDELTITSTPSTTVKKSQAGFNVGGRLDYRFGRSRRVGVGVQALYSTASVKLRAVPEATEATFDAGGFSVGAGLRVYF